MGFWKENIVMLYIARILRRWTFQLWISFLHRCSLVWVIRKFVIFKAFSVERVVFIMEHQNSVEVHLIFLVGSVCQNLTHNDEFWFKYFTIFFPFDGTSQNFCLLQSVMISIKISEILYAFGKPKWWGFDFAVEGRD